MNTSTIKKTVGVVVGLAFLGGVALQSFPTSTGPSISSQQTGGLPDVTPDVLRRLNPLDEMVVGSADAPVEIVKYTSLTCSHCANFHVQKFKQLKEKYIDTGLVRFVVRDFGSDPLAIAGAMLARCRQDLYFEVTDVLYQRQSEWTSGESALGSLRSYATQWGFGEQDFETCLRDQALYDGLAALRNNAVDIQVKGTPTFFVNGVRLVGNQPFAAFEAAIQAQLAE